MSNLAIWESIYDKYSLTNQQIEMIQFMNSRKKEGFGSILHADMGVGKTRTILAWIDGWKQITESSTYPCLVVCPTTVVNSWVEECDKTGFKNYFLDYYNKVPAGDYTKYDLVITTYGKVRSLDKKLGYSRHNQLRRKIPKLGTNETGFIQPIKCTGKKFDNFPEIMSKENSKWQPIKNAERRHNSFRDLKYKLEFEWPEDNQYYCCTNWKSVILDESHAICNHNTKSAHSCLGLYKDIGICLSGTPTKNDIKGLFAQLIFCGNKELVFKSHFHDKYDGYREFMHRQIKNADSLPRLHEHYVYTGFTPEQSKEYMGLINEVEGFIQKDHNGDPLGEFSKLLAIFTKMRQFCINTHKCARIFDLINSFPKDEKVLVFSNFSSKLRELNDMTEDSDILDGKVIGNKRLEVINNFRKNKDIRVLYVNYVVGSSGLNLQAASRIIFIEEWYNPTPKLQGAARAWRPGQTKPVHVYHMLQLCTIEDQLRRLCKNKEQMYRAIYDSSISDKVESKLSRDQMLEIIRLSGVYQSKEYISEMCFEVKPNNINARIFVDDYYEFKETKQKELKISDKEFILSGECNIDESILFFFPNLKYNGEISNYTKNMLKILR